MSSVGIILAPLKVVKAVRKQRCESVIFVLE